MVHAENSSPRATSYDAVAYPGYIHAQTHPDQMATKATLFGLSPAPAESCRVLELGCGEGTNLISFAQGLPGTEFVGVDLAASAIGRGQELIQGLGLKNITLKAESVTEISPDWGPFDYIIAHGIYSWVPEGVRDQILAICEANLAPHGVAQVSYNVHPGGHLRNMFREMMLFHTNGFADPHERVHQAIALVKFLGESQKNTDPYAQFLQQQFEHLSQREPSTIFHDELSEVHHPVWFHQFVEHATQHRLQYLAEADYVHVHYGNSQVTQALQQLGTNRIAREQYLDFLSFRRFRQTLLCHAERELRFGMTPEMLPRFYVSSPARPVSPQFVLSSNTTEEFVGENDSSLRIDDPFGKAALIVLSEDWPRAVPFLELLERTRAKLVSDFQFPISDLRSSSQSLLTPAAATPGFNARRFSEQPSPESLIDSAALKLFEAFLQVYAPGLVTLHLCPSKFALRPGSTPVASSLARWQARAGDSVITLRHVRITLNSARERHLLTLLDGTRDRAALARAMRAAPQTINGPPSPAGGASAPAPIDDPEGSKELEEILASFARSGLLVS